MLSAVYYVKIVTSYIWLSLIVVYDPPLRSQPSDWLTVSPVRGRGREVWQGGEQGHSFSALVTSHGKYCGSGKMRSSEHSLSPCSEEGLKAVCCLPSWKAAFVSFRPQGWNPEELPTVGVQFFTCSTLQRHLASSPLFRILGQVRSVQVLVDDLFVGATVSLYSALCIQKPSWQWGLNLSSSGQFGGGSEAATGMEPGWGWFVYRG